MKFMRNASGVGISKRLLNGTSLQCRPAVIGMQAWPAKQFGVILSVTIVLPSTPVRAACLGVKGIGKITIFSQTKTLRPGQSHCNSRTISRYLASSGIVR